MISDRTDIGKMNFQEFSIINALGIKFGLAVKKVKANADSSLIYANLVGPTCLMLHTNEINAIGLLVPDKKVFKSFFYLIWTL